jgi:GNAT superfamily N-acetyltransferase
MREVETAIRSATSDDAEDLARLAGELGYLSSTEETLTRLRRVMTAPGNSVLVAEDANEGVVGWVHVFGAVRVESDGFAELGGLVVAERWRGRGAGARLVAAAERWALDNGFRTMRIRSRAERGGAHGFFKRLGYLSSKTQKVFERPLQGVS